MSDILHPYQIVILTVSGFMIYQGIERFTKHEHGQTIWKIALRIVVWGGMATITLFPKLSNVLANMIGIEGNINAVVLTGFFLVFLILFKLLSAIERLERHVTQSVRTDAISSVFQNTRNNKN